MTSSAPHHLRALSLDAVEFQLRALSKVGRVTVDEFARRDRSVLAARGE